MTPGVDDDRTFDVLEARLTAILPAQYQDDYDDVQPVSMGSAGLKFDADGRVAWNQIWGSFCDLAMAGGPPHKGSLLEPGLRGEIDAQASRYREVVDELGRGIAMVTGLAARRAPTPGWIRVTCLSPAMADWLVRAITMENVAARAQRTTLDLPAAPHFRLDKEIKNVVTVIAKTCHYWEDHMDREQRREIAELFAVMATESALVAPAFSTDGIYPAAQYLLAETMTQAIVKATHLVVMPRRHAGWLGVECGSVRAAVWMMRMLVASNVLARREGTVLFVPVNPAIDPSGAIVVRAMRRVHGLAVARGVFAKPS